MVRSIIPNRKKIFSSTPNFNTFHINTYVDSNKDAELCAASKRRLRCDLPVDYNENVEYKRSRNRPKTAYAKVKEKIAEKIKEITELNQALTIHNRLKDRISVDDVSEIEDLLDDTDSEEEISLVDEIQTEENQNLNVDPSFSLEYGYVDDVSSL